MIREFRFEFWIRRTWNGPYEKFITYAKDSQEAVNNLPECKVWDFVLGQPKKLRSIKC